MFARKTFFVGWTPSQVGYVPGVPMQNSSFTSSVHHKSTSSHVFLTTLDYYGKVYRLDQTTTRPSMSLKIVPESPDALPSM